ncbi:T9SS type A sorting domain-containing protein [Rufibacter ruber]|uniref:T9SS type A sorting domain-containing protein n=1 Tax=Rufibacter ruber TaxID=1783499 RepID=UPI000830273C|nr:T9SS type A sorting domain-containing protein [Rufibacter ruber]
MKPIHQQRQNWMSCLLLLVFGALLYFSASGPAGEDRQGRISADEMKKAGYRSRVERLHKKGAIGSKDKPQARLEYEVERLKDPATGKVPEGIRELELAFSETIPTKEQVLRQLDPHAKFATENWNSRGPYNVGGRTRAMALDIANENVLLAGGVSGGMWRSSNGGASWAKVTGLDQLQSVTTISQDKRVGKQNVWYYGTGEMFGNSASAPGATYYGNGIYKSIDNGVTWSPLVSTQTANFTAFTNVFQFIYRVATNPANAAQDEVFAATVGSVRRSTDGGGTWQSVLGYEAGVNDFNASPYFTDIAIGNSGNMYAALSQYASGGRSATKRGIHRSTDGVTWTDITPGTFPASYERIVMDIAPSNENIVYFFVYTATNAAAEANLWKYEYLSGSGAGAGGRWTNLSANLPMLGGKSGDLDLQGGYNMVVKVKPDDPNFVVLGGTNLYRSLSGFTNTTSTRKIGGYVPDNSSFALYNNHHPDQHEVIFYRSNPNRMLSAHDGGVSRTNNNAAASVVWESLNRGYQTTQFYTVAMDLNTTDDFVVGGMQDNGSWAVDNINATTEWNEVVGGDGAFAAVTTHSLLVSVQNGTVYRIAFNDKGEDIGYARIDPPKTTGYLFVNPYTIDPNNEYTMFLPAGDTLWRNKNIAQIPLGGEQSNLGWEVVANLGISETISAVSVSKVPANVVYFGTSGGRLYKLQNGNAASPTRTEITGANFPKSASGAPTGYINCIAIDPKDANKAVVVFSNYKVQSLFYTTDGGATWTAVAGNLEENPDGSGNGPSARWVTILPNPDGTNKYFVGTSTGLYSTGVLEGAGTTWLREGNSSIGQVPVDMVLSRTTDDLVVVGTHGNGVFSLRYSGPLIPNVEDPNPLQTGLGLSYPNPYVQGTTVTIPFQLESAAQVQLQVFDMTGRKVASLVNGSLQAGKHLVTWRGSGLASGTYLYQLMVDGKRFTKRMVQLK